jgi:hypothetical protein
MKYSLSSKETADRQLTSDTRSGNGKFQHTFGEWITHLHRVHRFALAPILQPSRVGIGWINNPNQVNGEGPETILDFLFR